MQRYPPPPTHAPAPPQHQHSPPPPSHIPSSPAHAPPPHCHAHPAPPQVYKQYVEISFTIIIPLLLLIALNLRIVFAVRCQALR